MKDSILSQDDKIHLVFQLEIIFLLKLKPHFEDKQDIPNQLTKEIIKIENNIGEFAAISASNSYK